MYKDEILKYSPLTIDNIIEISRNLVPQEYARAPWTHPELKRGVALLESEDGLNAYIAAYGEAHILKIREALKRLPYDELNDDFEVYDWGCGQGLASLGLIEQLTKSNFINQLKQINLVEPSSPALKRAVINISAVIKKNVKVESIQKGLPATTQLPFKCIDKLNIHYPIVIHLFSNILDIGTVDLKRLAKLITSAGTRHYVVCIGPANREEFRISQFCRYFNISQTSYFADVREPQFFTSTQYNRHTFGCFVKGFKYTIEEGRPILFPYHFYAPKQCFASYRLDILEHSLEKTDSAFEVLAPFDFGASIYDDVNPIFAVINNLIVRGLPTKASPFIESLFSDRLKLSKREINLGTILYKSSSKLSEEDNVLVRNVPLSVARLEKTIIEILMTRKLSFAEEWNVLVKENDVPCAAIAFQELADMYNHLSALSQDFCDTHFPKVNLTIINKGYTNSKLHLDSDVYASADKRLRQVKYDLVIDIATNEICNPKDVEFSEFQAINDCYFNVRASETISDERHIYTTDRIVYKPLTKLTMQGTHEVIEEQANHLRYFLQMLFRKEDFRDGQLPIMSRALQLKSVIGLLPTGGGKSLTYQIAALLQPGVTIVVDPLVSLMKDQYDGLLKCGIDVCTFINSTVSDKALREKEIKESKRLFVFLSPERLAIFRFRNTLRAMCDTHVYFAYGVIDEVHCVSEWGHDFRFTYLHLGRNMYQYVLPKQTDNKELNHITMIGLTATASFDVLADVERELSGDSAFPLDPQSTVRYENTNRLELQYRIVAVDNQEAHSKWDIFEAKNQAVANVVRQTFINSFNELLTDESIKRIKSRFIARENIELKSSYAKAIAKTDLNVDVASDWFQEKDGKTAAIVFCPHRVGLLGVNNSSSKIGIAQQIKDGLGIDSVSTYCGGDVLSAQDKFISGETNIMVATKAFGMGIDKPNVRFTLNVNHSGSLEAFVQEAGRAGRDRKMALAVVLYNDRVFNEQNPNTRFIEQVPVDFGVHKFFYDGNFLGADFEKWVMYYLMAYQETSLAEVDSETRMNKSVSGFLSRMKDANVGDAIVAYISYSYPSKDSETLDGHLIKAGLQPVGANHKSLEDRKQRYYEALMKAIYRMCCIGLIEDYTQDYINEEFRIVTKKLTDEEYFGNLKTFLQRYFSEDRASIEIEHAKEYKGLNAAQKCLGYLTDFIYKSIATKRKQAIQDIDSFCKKAIQSSESWLEVNEELKDEIYFYFNSKYARRNFTAPNGEPFSLVEDTQEGKVFEFEHVFKYMRVIEDEIVGVGTPKDNVKHLLGAVRLIRRALTDKNPTLNFLNVFCILFLKADKEGSPMKNELEESYIDGYLEFKRRCSDSDTFYSQMNQFTKYLLNKKVISSKKLSYLSDFGLMAEASIHSEWASKFAEKFTI
jgi:ATP-dependent DNA helicase RecQ